MVNVNIIENGYGYPDKMEVIRLYREGLSMKRISELLDVNVQKVRRMLHEAKDKGEVEIRPSYGVNPRNYCFNKHNGRYHVYKHINGKFRQFGTYSDESTAQRVVEELRKVNWDKDCLKDIKKKLELN